MFCMSLSPAIVQITKPPWSKAAFLFMGWLINATDNPFFFSSASTQDHASAPRTQQTCCLVDQLGF